MNSSIMPWLVAIVGAGLAPEATCLEKSPVRKAAEADPWMASRGVTVSYYNVCTGWIWIWEWEPRTDLQLGVCFENAAEQALLDETGLFQIAWFPQGYAYSATVGVFEADSSGCPVGPALASQPYRAYSDLKWVPYSWNVHVPSSFVVAVTFSSNSPFLYSPGFLTDHPAMGPNGPPACGNCFPAARVTRSFIYNDDSGPHCPGERFSDSVCDAELIWYARLEGDISVKGSSWGRIKSLYY